MTDFEQAVLDKLSKIETAVAVIQTDHGRRIETLEKHNETVEFRHWIKSIVVGAGVIVLHPIARKLGLDI